MKDKLEHSFTHVVLIQGEESFLGDELLEGGVKTGLHNGTHYREERKYQHDKTMIMFFFATRCYGEYLQSILDDFKLDPPHVIIMNSCLWDLHRYGKTANSEYVTNIQELLDAIDLAVPYEDRLFIWNSTLPVRETVKAGFLPPGVDHTLPAEDIRKANLYVRDQLNSYGERFIFLDLHQTFYKHLDLRVKDGVHWNDFAHRKITSLILSEISKHWNIEMPSSKSPMPPLKDEMQPVGFDRSMNAFQRPNPQTLFGARNGPAMNGAPPRNNPGLRMNGLVGNFPRGPPGQHANRPRVGIPPGHPAARCNRPPLSRSPGGLPCKVNPSPRSMGNGPPRMRPPLPRGNAPRGINSNYPTNPRINSPLVGRPLGNDERITRNGHLGNAPIRNRPVIGPAGPRNRRGRTRSSTVNPVGPRPPPPRRWMNGPPRFLNNNEYLPPGFLNETFPPAFPGKRKYVVEDDFHRPYKFPRM